MKILLVIPLVFGGGAEQVAAVLSREWAASHEVRVLTFHLGAEQLDYGVPIETLALPAQSTLWGRIKNAWRRVRGVRQSVKAFQPDVVMAFMDEAGMVCALAALADHWRGRLVVSVHHNPQWLSRSRRFLLAMFYRLPARVVAVSQGVCDELRASMRLSSARLIHIPNPLVIRKDSEPDAHGAEPAALPEGFILFVGRLDWHAKGLDVLLSAYALQPAGRPPLVIVGDGKDRERLIVEAANLGIQDDIRLIGWVRDPLPYYRHAAVFVMSSRFEGWSNVLMEAMGEGCLVAGTCCPYGPPEILGQQLHYLLTPVGDASALAETIQTHLALTGPARVAMQNALRERARRFAAPLVARQWIELAQALGEKGR